MPLREQDDQFEDTIRSVKPEFELPEGIEERVDAAMAAAASSQRPALPWLTTRRVARAVAAMAVLALGAGVLWSLRGTPPAEDGIAAHVQTDVASETTSPSATDIVETAVVPGRTQPDADRSVAIEGSQSLAPGEQDASVPAVATADEIPPLVLIAAGGAVTRADGQALAVGDRVANGSAVGTGAGARATLVTRRGAELTLDADSEIVLAQDGRQVGLERGRLYCRNRAREFAAIATPAGQVELLGTTVDVALTNGDGAAVTVVDGSVRLANAEGNVIVTAGKKTVMVASLPPEAGVPVNTVAETAWYDGSRRMLSDDDVIAYTVARGDRNISEIWTMNADGSGKHRLKSYIGSVSSLGPWLPGEQVLLVRPAGLLWAYPDFDKRRADTHSGTSVVDPWITRWLLDAATGQDVLITVPPEYNPFGTVLSPDAAMMAFTGTRRDDPSDSEHWEAGVWLHDLTSGAITKVFDEMADAAPAWSPDGSRLAIPAGMVWSGDYSLRLVIVEVETGAVTDLHVAGTDPCFSPDGTKLAYVSDMTGQRTSRDQAKVFVMDLASGSEPQQISPGPEGMGSSEPLWSPDGTMVAYRVVHVQGDGRERSLRVALADGSGSWEVYRGMFWPAAWDRTGGALYVSDRERGALLIAADGSGAVAELGGTADDSPLSAREQAEFDAAQSVVREGVFQHATGKRYAYFGRPAEAKAAHRRSADLFAELPWRCPHLGLSVTNAVTYADAEGTMADQSAGELLVQTCKQRLSHAAFLVSGHQRVTGEFPASLEAAERWSKTREETTMNDVIKLGCDDISVVFRCPEGDLFTYTPPAPGTEPVEGDVILSCPNHGESIATWKKQGDEWNADTPSGWRITQAF